MPEYIEKIEECRVERDRYGSPFEGYRIKTTEQEILVLIDSVQSCCEDWGYLSTNDDPEKFIGAEFRSITIMDLDRFTKEIKLEIMGKKWACLEEGGAVFVNINTDRGEFQLVVYNMHNGYYGHDVLIKARELEYSEVI